MNTTRRKPGSYKPEVRKKYTRSAKSPYRCLHCPYTADSLAALILHTGRSHTGAVRTATPKERQARKPGLDRPAKWELAPAADNGASAPALRGRPRKLPPPVVAAAASDHWHICPRCGLDLELAAHAYAVAESMKRNT
jgi:predicted RNA-binding Zn-ribbon protein involved in translation (DUF1610 family)